MEFAQIIKYLREERGLSQKELSTELGLSSSGIGHLELGKREPSSSSLTAYAKYFGVSTDYLLGLEDDFGTKVVSPIALMEQYSKDEKELIEKYRSLDPRIKKLIREQVDIYSGREEILPKTDKKV